MYRSANEAKHAHGEPASDAAPVTLLDVHQSKDWANTPGAELDAAFTTDVNSSLRDQNRSDAILALGESGYECIYGEEHEAYPEPAAQCTRSFASRSCQFDWEMFLTTDPAVPGEVDTLETSVRRDFVGTADDWPEPVKSAINN